MRLRSLFAKTAAFVASLVTFYLFRSQHTFQGALKGLNITFDDFPIAYNAALNASRTEGEPLVDFDYNSTFPSPLIPRTIHFIHFADLYRRHDGTPSLPETARSHAPELCLKFNPSFEIRIWNETEAHTLIETEYPWFIPTYDTYKHPIQRVDALKYFVLYHFGGVYMDLDIACRRPLEPLLQFPAWFPEASPLGVNNDLMANTASFRILPQIFYSEEYTFFGHSPGGTWHGRDVAIVLWLVERPLAVVSVLFGCVVLALGIAKGVRRRKIQYRRVEEGTLGA
ncbi:hypothetical protein N0V91_009449 [Didymella pomorum]|uniref:Glycosyltransferase family 32 protein n=1 Tax=Didymella pomorum TaxID=749634 RepID=A0A9W8Z7G6_9PLEO|nr:hypothetical protein N0V91_009449 [Didymella pomorum]